jgi:hypothetical protein
VSRFPKADVVTEATASAAALRAAADELDKLASEAPALEPGTLRRRLRSVGLEVANNMGGEDTDG